MRNLSSRLTAVAAALMAAAGSIAAIFRHRQFSSAEDLAMFDQMLWNFRQGRGLLTTLSGNMNLLYPHHFFGEHFSPILLLVAPIAGLTSGPEAILVLQAVALALSMIPAYLLARDALQSNAAGGTAALLWLLLPAFWIAALYDFHPDAFEPLLLLSFWLMLRRGSKACWVWALLYLSCKEDTAIYLFAAALAGGRLFRQRRLGYSIAAGALVYAGLTLLVAIPHFSPTGKSLMASRPLLPSEAGGIFPWLEALLTDPMRWKYLGVHLLSFAGLPLLAGPAAIPAALSIGLMWVSKSPHQQSILLHYVFTVYPLLWIAAMEGARWLMTRNWSSAVACRRILTPAWVLSVLASGLLFFGYRTYDEPFGKIHFGSTAAARESLRRIPPDASVAADWSLVAHLARRERLALAIEPFGADNVAVRIDGLNHGPARFAPELLLATNSSYALREQPAWPVAVFRKGSGEMAGSGLREKVLHTFEATLANHEIGRSVIDRHSLNGHAWYAGAEEKDGAVMFGPNLELPEGTYEVIFRIRTRSRGNSSFGHLDVAEACGGRVAVRYDLIGTQHGYTNIALIARVTGLGNVEFRCFKIGRGDIWVDRATWRAVPATTSGGK